MPPAVGFLRWVVRDAKKRVDSCQEERYKYYYFCKRCCVVDHGFSIGDGVDYH